MNAVISTNEKTKFVAGYVIYNPAYTYKFQLKTNLDVNLPGFHKHIINIDTVEIQISGKWFNYGIIFLVMIFDLNMWKNQIFYYPEKYGQYIGELVFRLSTLVL